MSFCITPKEFNIFWISLNSFKSWDDRQTAEREYADMAQKLKRGEYTLHIYGNGEVTIDYQ